MKALTICQPYAHLIAIGEKRVENRTWPTSYRGPIAIHAGKSKAWLTGDDPEHMDFGAVVAIANLVECLAMRRIERNDFNIIQYPWLRRHQHTQGPWCWVLENVRMLETPIPWKGAQGLWEFDEFALPYNVWVNRRGHGANPALPARKLPRVRLNPLLAGGCQLT